MTNLSTFIFLNVWEKHDNVIWVVLNLCKRGSKLNLKATKQIKHTYCNSDLTTRNHCFASLRNTWINVWKWNMTPAAWRTGSTTVFRETREVSWGEVLMWHLNAKLTEVLLSLPLTEYLQGTAFLFCPYILRSNHFKSTHPYSFNQ